MNSQLLFDHSMLAQTSLLFRSFFVKLMLDMFQSVYVKYPDTVDDAGDRVSCLSLNVPNEDAVKKPSCVLSA